MTGFGFWIPIGIGGAILLYSIVLYTHSYWHDRELRNPRIIGILMFIGFALTSTPYWDEMGAKIPGGYEFEPSRKQQEQEMKVFVSTKKRVAAMYLSICSMYEGMLRLLMRFFSVSQKFRN